jgi:hypothetical protein
MVLICGSSNAPSAGTSTRLGRGSDQIGQLAAELQRSGKRPQHGGTDWGRHSSDVMDEHASGRPSPSDPGSIGSQETVLISPGGNANSEMRSRWSLTRILRAHDRTARQRRYHGASR